MYGQLEPKMNIMTVLHGAFISIKGIQRGVLVGLMSEFVELFVGYLLESVCLLFLGYGRVTLFLGFNMPEKRLRGCSGLHHPP